MEDNSKESDLTDNSGKQNNNSINNGSSQQSSSDSDSKNIVDNCTKDDILLNNEGKSCDKGSSSTMVPQHGDSKCTQNKEDASALGVTKMEVGSPEKNATLVNDNRINSDVMTHTEGPMTAATNNCSTKEPSIDFKVIYNKKKYDVTLPLDTDIGALKTHLHPIIDIPPAMMKVMIKGLAKDEMTLKKLGITKGSKVMVIGSSLNDVLQVSTTPKDATKDSSSTKDKDTSSSSETCKQKQHKKVLDKGKPDDVMPGILGIKEHLPTQPLSGMLNKHGGKVRLTFKMENDQVWIGTKERTEKLPLNSIKNVVSEPIDGHKEYHIVALQLGPTEASRYWIYWVPAQYVDAIKDCILGKWQLF